MPTKCTCIAIRQAARRLTQMYDTALAPVGLRITQYSLLSTLDRLGPSTLGQLAEEAVLDRSTLGHNLRPLERDRLVRVAVAKGDRRARRLELTAAGRKKLAEARPLRQRAEDAFAAVFGDAEALRTMMHRVVAAVEP